MITVENLLDAYALALDLWMAPELAMLENGHPRENPTQEYAELIRKAVSAENVELRGLVKDAYDVIRGCADYYVCPSQTMADGIADRMRELGIEVEG